MEEQHTHSHDQGAADANANDDHDHDHDHESEHEHVAGSHDHNGPDHDDGSRRMPTSEEVKTYFDTVAQNWDTMRPDYYGVEVIEMAVQAAGLPALSSSDQYGSGSIPGAQAYTLVDVGCGTGFLSAGLAPRARKIIGVDSSPGMLAVAQENLWALGTSNVELRLGSVDALSLESNQADAAFANMVLHHAPDPQHMVVEMTRVTKPGGRVVITDMDAHTNEWFRTEMSDVWLGFTETQARRYMQSAGLIDIDFGWVGTQ